MSSYLVTQLSTAPSSLQIPYLPLSDNEPKVFEAFKEAIVTKCGSERREVSLGSRFRSRNGGSPRQVVGISMPPLDSLIGKVRREAFSQSRKLKFQSKDFVIRYCILSIFISQSLNSKKLSKNKHHPHFLTSSFIPLPFPLVWKAGSKEEKTSTRCPFTMMSLKLLLTPLFLQDRFSSATNFSRREYLLAFSLASSFYYP